MPSASSVPPAEGVPDQTAELDRAAELLRLLADRTRLGLLLVLIEGEASVGDLAARLGRPLPAVSQHLARLRSGHLVTARREGSTVYYATANEHVEALVVQVLRQAEHTLYPVPPHHR